MRLQDTSYARDGRGLLEVIDALAQRGWSDQATPLEGAQVRCEVCGATTPAPDVQIDALARVEGASDPDDMAAVVALTCGHCSAKIALVLSYGPEASMADADVLLALPDPPEVRESGLPDS